MRTVHAEPVRRLAITTLVGAAMFAAHVWPTVTGSAQGAVNRVAASNRAAAGEASQPPAQILAGAAAALRSARSVGLRGTVIDGSQLERFTLVTTGPGSVRFSYASDGERAKVIALPSGTEVRANTAYWRPWVGAQARRLAGRWIRVPRTTGAAEIALMKPFAPATLSRCLSEHHGSLSFAGDTVIGGRRAIVLRDAGNVPGSAPSLIALAATGTPYPLRLTITGDRRAGGQPDACNSGAGSDARGTLTFSSFGRIPPIRPPAGAVRALL